MPPSLPAWGGGGGLTPAGTNIVFKSLGKKTTIKQLRLGGWPILRCRERRKWTCEKAHLFGAKQTNTEVSV